MGAVLIPFFVLLLFSFYLSLTCAAILPRNTIIPLSCPGNVATYTQDALNKSSPFQRPACLPPSPTRSIVTADSCASAFNQLIRVSRTLWIEPRYEWAGDGGFCTIILKAEKVPPPGGERFLIEAVDEAATRIVEGCGILDTGRPLRGPGLGGSLGLEVTAEGLKAGEWRVWVLGRGAGAVEASDEDLSLLEGSVGAQQACTS